jgi:hypothetical protein
MTRLTAEQLLKQADALRSVSAEERGPWLAFFDDALCAIGKTRDADVEAAIRFADVCVYMSEVGGIGRKRKVAA